MAKFHMTVEENVGYAKRMIVDSIWKEAHLEGINATFPQTQEIYDGRSVAGLSVEGTVAINNLKHAWFYLLESLNKPLTIDTLKSFNREIGSGIIRNSGEFRTFIAMISGCDYRPAVPSEKDAQDLIDEIDSLEGEMSGLVAFAKIAKMQLFPDGNKRTAQLVANKILIASGAGVLSVPIEEKQNLGMMLVDYYTGDDLNKFVDYLRETCLHGMVFENR